MNNTTYLNKDHFIKCNELIYKYYFFNMIFIFDILDALFVLFLIYISNYILAIIFTLLIILFPILLNILIKKKTKESIALLFKNNNDLFVYDYKFSEDSFKVNIFYKDKNKEYNFSNEKVLRVIEEDDNIYIFVDKTTCFVVEKKGFVKYDKLYFQSLFKGKAKKYIIK